MEMKLREGSHPAYRFQIQIIVKMLVDIVQRALHPRMIVSKHRLHRPLSVVKSCCRPGPSCARPILRFAGSRRTGRMRIIGCPSDGIERQPCSPVHRRAAAERGLQPNALRFSAKRSGSFSYARLSRAVVHHALPPDGISFFGHATCCNPTRATHAAGHHPCRTTSRLPRTRQRTRGRKTPRRPAAAHPATTRMGQRTFSAANRSIDPTLSPHQTSRKTTQAAEKMGSDEPDPLFQN